MVWGTTVEIIAAATMIQVGVYEVTDSLVPGRPRWTKFSPRFELQIQRGDSSLNTQKMDRNQVLYACTIEMPLRQYHFPPWTATFFSYYPQDRIAYSSELISHDLKKYQLMYTRTVCHHNIHVQFSTCTYSILSQSWVTGWVMYLKLS